VEKGGKYGSFWSEANARHVPADRQDHETSGARKELGRVQDLARKSEPENASKKTCARTWATLRSKSGTLHLTYMAGRSFGFNP
jgi:hypothetical protein